MIGVDYASVDQNIRPDTSAAKAAGVGFAVIRGSYSDWADPTWRRDADAWRAAGVPVGGYLFPVLSELPAPQVAAFDRGSDLGPGDLPPVLDVEFPGGIAKTGLSRDELLKRVLDFVKAMQDRFSVAPMIYTSARVWDGEDADALDADRHGFGALHSTMKECPLWLARYPYKTRIQAVGDTAEERKVVDALPWPTVPKAWGDQGNVWIHQYEGDAVKLAGFSATVDLNRFRTLRHGDSGERVRWLQRRLKMAEGTPGVFDDATDDAVREFQARAGLVADGIVGVMTFARVAWA